MDKAKRGMDKVLELLSTVIFIAMVLLVTFQVISRYVFKSPSSVSEILTRYLFVWLIIVSATYIFGQREHICISFVKDKLGGKAKKAVNILIELIIVVFAGSIMVYGGAVITRMNMLQYDSILNIPTGIMYSVIPICGVLIIVYCFMNIKLLLDKKIDA